MYAVRRFLFSDASMRQAYEQVQNASQVGLQAHMRKACESMRKHDGDGDGLQVLVLASPRL